MIVFIDFEASSLSKNSYPIEVAWVFEDGSAYTILIRPAPGWDDWANKAEAIHHIARQRLEAEGSPVVEVASTMVEALSGHDICASAPSWDGKWLSALLRAGGFPRHTLRLQKSDDVFVAVARQQLGANVPDEEIARLVQEIIDSTEPQPPAHRALPDAMVELLRFNRVREIADLRQP